MLQENAVIVAFYSTAEDAGKEEVEEHWDQNASVFHAVRNCELVRRLSIGEYQTFHVIMELVK